VSILEDIDEHEGKMHELEKEIAILVQQDDYKNAQKKQVELNEEGRQWRLKLIELFKLLDKPPFYKP